jgi:hypothetical protein
MGTWKPLCWQQVAWPHRTTNETPEPKREGHDEEPWVEALEQDAPEIVHIDQPFSTKKGLDQADEQGCETRRSHPEGEIDRHANGRAQPRQGPGSRRTAAKIQSDSQVIGSSRRRYDPRAKSRDSIRHRPDRNGGMDTRSSQIRRAARRVAHLIKQAEATLEEATGVINRQRLPEVGPRGVDPRRREAASRARPIVLIADWGTSRLSPA